MPSEFRKISRIGSLMGGTKWYLSDDCLLAAKRVLYTVEYRRFYLRDLESITVWPFRAWVLRPIIPGVLFGGLAVSLGLWVSSMSGLIFAGIGLAWVALELALGPTAQSRIRTTGASVDLPLMKRTRRARRILAKIDAAVRVAKGSLMGQPIAPMAGPQPTEPSIQTNSEAASVAAPIADPTGTNASS